MSSKALLDLIALYYTKTMSKGGRLPYPLETMLRIHLLHQWYDLSDPAMDDALIEVARMRHFAGISLITDRTPDETTILAFLGQNVLDDVRLPLSAGDRTALHGGPEVG